MYYHNNVYLSPYFEAYKHKKLPEDLEAFAERARFELAVEFNPYDGLANRWFQPLTHLSKAENLKAKDNI